MPIPKPSQYKPATIARLERQRTERRAASHASMLERLEAKAAAEPAGIWSELLAEQRARDALAAADRLEVESARHFVAETLAHVRSLTADQRHEAARRTLDGLARMAAAIRTSRHAAALVDVLALVDHATRPA